MDSERTVRVGVRIWPCYPENGAEKPFYVQTEQKNDNGGHGMSVMPLNGFVTNDIENTGLVHIVSPNPDGSTATDENAERTTFAIQHALPYGCTQQDVYADAVQPLVKKFLQGFDASFITYGQSGTGKSHTMFGPGLDIIYGESDQGIAQRAIRDIFADLVKRRACQYSINCTCIEVHENDVYDMIGGGVRPCHTIIDAFQCIQKGLANRKHKHSHMLFTMTLEQQWVTPNGIIQHILSTASFCDLCATERMSAIDECTQMPTTVPSDCGLQALERIVSTLTEPTIHPNEMNNPSVSVQYESTMLTKLLRDSFGGRAYLLLMICVSPLDQDLVETVHNLQFAHKVQYVRNIVSMNTFSDNNMPITDLIDPMVFAAATAAQLPSNQLMPMSIPVPLPMPLPLPQALHYNPLVSMERMNATNTQNAFSMKFVTTQLMQLMAKADGIFSKQLTSGMIDPERECIEEWMYLKQECEACLSSADLTSNQRLLGPIQETTEQDDEAEESEGIEMANDVANPLRSISASQPVTKKSQFDATDESTEENTICSEMESDSDDQPELKEILQGNVAELMVTFSTNTSDMVNRNYDRFVVKYPDAVTHSTDDANRGNDDGATKLRCSMSAAAADVEATTGAVGGDKGGTVDNSNDGAVGGDAGDGAAATGSNSSTRRRRSIQPSSTTNDRLVLSSADLERLQKIADESIRNSQSLNMNNSVCRKAVEFLENSLDMHPLRVLNATRARENLLTEIQKKSYILDDKRQRIKVLTENMANTTKLISEHTNEQRTNAKKSLKSSEQKLKTEREMYRRSLMDPKNRHVRDATQEIQAKLLAIEKDLSSLREISADSDKKIDEYQSKLQTEKKELKRLTKEVKKDQKALDDLKVKHRNECLKDLKDDRRSMAMTENVNPRITQLDCVLEEKKEHLRVNKDGESDKVESIRHEIRNLRDQRDRLSDAQCILKQNLKKDKRLNERDVRQILEYEVAKEVIDHAVEMKNLLISGRDVTNKIAAFVDNPDLMGQLCKLNEREMRILLFKCFKKIVDLRESSRELESQVIQLEHDRKEWELRELSLMHRFEQLRLEKEQQSLHLGKQYEETFTKLLQATANKCAGGSQSSAMGHNVSMMLAQGRGNFMGNVLSKTSHRRQQGVSNIFQGIHGYNEVPSNHAHVADTAIATTSKCEITDIFDQKQKSKSSLSNWRYLNSRRDPSSMPQLSNSSRRGHLMLANHPSTSTAISEPKVMVAKNKIIINQNKPSNG